MKTLIITEASILIAFFVVSVWWMTDFYGLPQRIKCKIGVHDHSVYEVEKGIGFFGGPTVTYYWTCQECGDRGVT